MNVNILGNVLTALLLFASEQCLVNGATATARTFTDDLGVIHTFAKKKPKVVAWSHVAISLAHLGT